MVLQGMASWNNPLGRDDMIPSGCGATLAFRAGTGQIGPKSYNPDSKQCELVGAEPEEPSLIEGFECMIAASGGANVDGATGQPLTHLPSSSLVPPNVYCLDRIRGHDLVAGLEVGPNADVRASRLNIELTQYCAVTMANVTANVATVLNTSNREGLPDGCPSVDGVTCSHPAQDLCCETCRREDVDFLAIAGAGLTAPTKLTLTQSTIEVSGQNPILGNLDLDPNTLVAQCETALTIGRRQACLATAPICVSKGADTILYPELVYLLAEDNDIRISSPGLVIDNLESPSAENNSIALLDNCYSPDGDVCADPEGESNLVGTAAALPSGEADPEILATNTEVVEEAASEPKDDTGTEAPEITTLGFEDFLVTSQGDRFGVDIPGTYQGFDWAYGSATKIATWGSFTVQHSGAPGGNSSNELSIAGAGESENWLKARASSVGKGAKITALDPVTGFVFESMKLYTQDHPAFVGQISVTWRTTDNETSSGHLIDLVDGDWVNVTAEDLGLQGEVLKAMWFNGPGIRNPDGAKFGLDRFSVQPEP